MGGETSQPKHPARSLADPMQDTSRTWVAAGGNVAGQVRIEKSECRSRVLSKAEVARSREQSRGLRSRSSAAGGQRRGDCAWGRGGRAGCARSPGLAPAHGFGSLRVGTRPDSCWTPASHGFSPTAGNGGPDVLGAHGATGFPTVTGPGGAGNGPGPWGPGQGAELIWGKTGRRAGLRAPRGPLTLSGEAVLPK